MGDETVIAYVAANLTSVSCSAYRVLLRMAVPVLDHESEPGAADNHLYFAGWRTLTTCLGYGVTHEDDPISANAERAIARAIKELRAAGLVELAPRKVQRGHRDRVYYLPPLPVRFYQ